MKNIIKFFLVIFIFSVGSIQIFATPDSKSSTENATYQVPILVYHSFGPAKSKDENAMQLHYRVTTKVFEEQMAYLSDNGYHPISFASYVSSLQNKIKLPEKSVILTFDDGWFSQYKYAVPILEKYNFTATFFIIASYPDPKNKLYMTWNDLKDLVAHNFDIESHTVTHAMLTKITSKKLVSELSESKKMLEEKLKIKVTTLAYPYYAQNIIVREAVKSAGYVGARAGWVKFANPVDNIYQLKSQEVVNNPNPFSAKRLPDLP